MKKLFLVVNNDKFFLSHRKPIALAAQKFSYEVTVVTSFTGLESQICDLGLNLVQLPMNTTGMNLKDEFRAYQFLKRLYKKERPDIVHHVGLKPVLWGTAAASDCHIENVVNAISGTGFLFSPDKKNTLISRLVRAYLRMRSKPCYQYIFQNHDDEHEFIADKIITSEQSVFIKGSGVDLEKFRFVYESEKDNSRMRIVFTGRMIESKGVLVLVNAAKQLKSAYLNSIQFILCGDLDANPSALKKEQIEAFCDGDYIKWLGFQKDIYSVLKQCHIMAFPSFYMEGLPKSVIDAEAAGLPVITTDWVGCRDTVVNGYNGFLVPPKNADALAERIELLVCNAELRQQMGKNARRYAEENFSIENVVNKHLELYMKLLK